MGVGQVISEGEHNVHVVSFDLFATANLLKIATLDHDPKRLGRLSAEQLLRRFQNPTDSIFVTEVMKVEMKRYLPFSAEGKDRV
jgi:DNA-binding LacI/PurR family transcriptional regulator